MKRIFENFVWIASLFAELRSLILWTLKDFIFLSRLFYSSIISNFFILSFPIEFSDSNSPFYSSETFFIEMKPSDGKRLLSFIYSRKYSIYCSVLMNLWLWLCILSSKDLRFWRVPLKVGSSKCEDETPINSGPFLLISGNRSFLFFWNFSCWNSKLFLSPLNLWNPYILSCKYHTKYLSDKRRHVGMLEVLRKNYLFEF